jgi:hypothetical protein
MRRPAKGTGGKSCALPRRDWKATPAGVPCPHRGDNREDRDGGKNARQHAFFSTLLGGHRGCYVPRPSSLAPSRADPCLAHAVHLRVPCTDAPSLTGDR